MKRSLEEAERRKDVLPFLDLLSAWTLVLGMGDAFANDPRPEVSGRMDAGLARWIMETVSVEQKRRAKFLPHISQPSMWTVPVPRSTNRKKIAERGWFVHAFLPPAYADSFLDLERGSASFPGLSASQEDFKELLDCIFSEQLPWSVPPDVVPPRELLDENFFRHLLNKELSVLCGKDAEGTNKRSRTAASAASLFAPYYYRHAPEQLTVLDLWIAEGRPYERFARKFGWSWIHVPYGPVPDPGGRQEALFMGELTWTFAIRALKELVPFHSAARFGALLLENHFLEEEKGTDRFFLPFRDAWEHIKPAIANSRKFALKNPQRNTVVEYAPRQFLSESEVRGYSEIVSDLKLDRETDGLSLIESNLVSSWAVSLASVTLRNFTLQLNSVVLRTVARSSLAFLAEELGELQEPREVFVPQDFWPFVSDTRNKMLNVVRRLDVRRALLLLKRMDALNSGLLFDGILEPAAKQVALPDGFFSAGTDPDVEKYLRQWGKGVRILGWREEKIRNLEYSGDPAQRSLFDEKGALRHRYAYRPRSDLPSWDEEDGDVYADDQPDLVRKLAESMAQELTAPPPPVAQELTAPIWPGFSTHELVGQTRDIVQGNATRDLADKMALLPQVRKNLRRYAVFVYDGEQRDYFAMVLERNGFFALGNPDSPARTRFRRKAFWKAFRASAADAGMYSDTGTGEPEWLDLWAAEGTPSSGGTRRTYVYALWAFLNGVRGMEAADFRTTNKLFPTIREYVQRKFYSKVKRTVRRLRPPEEELTVPLLPPGELPVPLLEA